MAKTVKAQCDELGIEVPVGKTAAEVRAMGVEVRDYIPDHAVLCADDGREVLDLEAFDGKPTGYHWAMSFLAQEREIAIEQDEHFRRTVLGSKAN
jgi:hypothetical protein